MFSPNLKNQIAAGLAAVMSAVIFISASIGPATTQLAPFVA